MEVENGMLYRIMDIDMDMADHFKCTPACWGHSNLCCEPCLGLLFAWPFEAILWSARLGCRWWVCSLGVHRGQLG